MFVLRAPTAFFFFCSTLWPTRVKSAGGGQKEIKAKIALNALNSSRIIKLDCTEKGNRIKEIFLWLFFSLGFAALNCKSIWQGPVANCTLRFGPYKLH